MVLKFIIVLLLFVLSAPTYAGRYDGIVDIFNSSSRNWDSNFLKHNGRVTHTQYNQFPDGVREVDRYNPAKNSGYGKVYTNRMEADGSMSKYNVTVGPGGVINGRPMK